MSNTVPLPLQGLHQNLGATFSVVDGSEVVARYGNVATEYIALKQQVGCFDLSFRSRICLTGSDRVRFLHGQVTNEIKRLRVGEGCYAALTTAKGKMQSDLNIYCLQDELLLDFEPGLTRIVTERLEKYLVADDVQVVEVAPHYGLFSVQGPQAKAAIQATGLFSDLPAQPLGVIKLFHAELGELYLMNHARLGSAGYDLFVPVAVLERVAKQLLVATQSVGGCACGWDAFEIARIEAGVPRFGWDMEESNLASECGIEARAISYNKGCYIGQEVLNRIHSVGHVNRELRGLRLAAGVKALPVRGTKLFHHDKEVGYVTSVAFSPDLNCGVALGYVRRESFAPGTELQWRGEAVEGVAQVVMLPALLG